MEHAAPSQLDMFDDDAELSAIGVTRRQLVLWWDQGILSFDPVHKTWQQTWVDNVGGSTEYLQGKFDKNKIIYNSSPFPFSKDTMAIRKMTFTNLSSVKLRQHGEISKDNGVNWATEYDLEYRRKK